MNRIVRLTALLLTVAALAACGEASVPATEEPLPADTIVACDGLPLAGGADLDSLLRRPGGHRIETVRGSGRTHYDVETKERL
ncbi:hypothetical protein [Alistipes sp.]|mgnify:CR=1 FL=1|uniref:hypothetical protein n=1 Tax=Alistipes sp. TaxID=1872444 RepID=UPI000E964CAB|nr:hypothetical protein [Alistipes sp.]HBX90900.1 hypothetical protein [Alistipes sp.]HCN12944.1 hypothetical protein [Alistipes sp.]